MAACINQINLKGQSVVKCSDMSGVEAYTGEVDMHVQDHMHDHKELNMNVEKLANSVCNVLGHKVRTTRIALV